MTLKHVIYKYCRYLLQCRMCTVPTMWRYDSIKQNSQSYCNAHEIAWNC